jgi:hypothetical protein
MSEPVEVTCTGYNRETDAFTYSNRWYATFITLDGGPMPEVGVYRLDPKTEIWCNQFGKVHREMGPAVTIGGTKIYVDHGYELTESFYWQIMLARYPNRFREIAGLMLGKEE